MQEQSKKECGVEEGDSLIKTQPWPQRVGLCMLASTRPWKDGAVGLSNSILPFAHILNPQGNCKLLDDKDWVKLS